MERERDKLIELQKQTVVHKAAIILQNAWRKKKMVPSCPHCDRGIFPEDELGRSTVSKELELARRKKKPNNTKG